MKYIVNDDVVLSRPPGRSTVDANSSVCEVGAGSGIREGLAVSPSVAGRGVQPMAGTAGDHCPTNRRHAFGSIYPCARASRPDPPRRYRCTPPLRGVFASDGSRPLEDGHTAAAVPG